MNSSEKTWWWHDDGIFRYRKSYEWEPTQIVQESAREVISAFGERDRIWNAEAGERRDAWNALPEAEKAKPWVTQKPVPRSRKAWERPTTLEIRAEEEYMRNLVESRNRQTGRFRTVVQDAGNKQTGVENAGARKLNAFPFPRELDFPDLQTAGYFHEIFCWTVAIRSAFRILDLYQIRDVGFPPGWVHVDCPADHPGHLSLVASASYQMGIYATKAQAMQRVPQVYRASKMTRSRKGTLNPLGEVVIQACGEMHAMGLPLKDNDASGRLLAFLAERDRAQLNPPSIDGMDAPSWKIGRLMKRFRDANGLSVGKTRSAKAGG